MQGIKLHFVEQIKSFPLFLRREGISEEEEEEGIHVLIVIACWFSLSAFGLGKEVRNGVN